VRALAALHGAGHDIALVLTQPDRPAGRGQQSAAGPVKRFAAGHGLEVFQPEALKSPEAAARLRAVHPDVLVVVAYGVLLPSSLLDIAPQGALNIHASLLPRWRGAAPIQRALLAGDLETGVSIMKMDAGLDTGPVLTQRSVPITEGEDGGTLHEKLAALGAEMLVMTLADLREGRTRALPQAQAGVTYARKIEKDETRLDWSRPAVELERAVRAFRPSPGAFSLLEGEPLKIWRAGVRDDRGSPGTVLRVRDDAILVGCGQGALEVTELQRPGARRLRVAEFLRGRALAPGSRFG
jgi:methionyl-tRNA formyltransferase